MKRQMTERVDVGMLTSPATKQDIENVDLIGVKGAVFSCDVSSTHLDVNAFENDAGTSKDIQDVATVGNRLIGSVLDVPKKKKMKQNQLSLTSFFCKVSNGGENVDNFTKDASDNQESTFNSLDYAKETTETVKPESDFDEGATSQEPNMSTVCCPGNDKKTAAVMEWQRIQQLMQDSIPLCEGHREPCVSRVVKKPGPTFGRRFYVCSRAEGPSSNPETRCDFFRWAGSKSRQKK